MTTGADFARHHSQTAGKLARRGILQVQLSETAQFVRERLTRETPETVDPLIAVDPAGKYAGTIELRPLLAAPGTTTAGALLRADWPVVGPAADREHAADVAAGYRVAALPVIAADGTPIGIIPPEILLETLAAEHQEDVHRTAGILARAVSDRHALEDPPLRRVWLRLPWLVIGLLLSTAGTALMAGFEKALQANVTLAFFIPAIVYLTDAIGTQTEAIAVRGLSIRHRPLARILASEMITGGLIGLALGVIAYLGVLLTFRDATTALGVGISLFAAGSLASTLGLLLPWGLSRLGIDPAFGSGPIATIIQDVLTILVYFLVMTALSPG
jgi:magnesium transporter